MLRLGRFLGAVTGLVIGAFAAIGVMAVVSGKVVVQPLDVIINVAFVLIYAAWKTR